MLNRLIFLVSLVAAIIIAVMMNMTTPAEIGPLGVLFFFILVYIMVFGVVTAIWWVFRRIIGKKRGMVRKEYYYTAMISLGPIMLLLVQSFGGLSIFTIGLVALFVLLGCFLINKRL